MEHEISVWAKIAFVATSVCVIIGMLVVQAQVGFSINDSSQEFAYNAFDTAYYVDNTNMDVYADYHNLTVDAPTAKNIIRKNMNTIPCYLGLVTGDVSLWNSSSQNQDISTFLSTASTFTITVENDLNGTPLLRFVGV